MIFHLFLVFLYAGAGEVIYKPTQYDVELVFRTSLAGDLLPDVFSVFPQSHEAIVE